ncbi:MAG: phosphoribosyltransferase [Thermoplasmata archaeon]|nr:phosphoribosyltransferase [Thermoplasmata archaeon]
MDEFPRCRRSTWADLETWADHLAGQIRRADAVPETLVALTRGGWVPARMVADRLGIRRLLAVRAQHWGVTARPDGKAELTEGLAHPIAGQSVLVVDDIADTGESLRLAVDHVRSAGPASVQSATCLCIAHAKFRPTYVAEEIPSGAWVWVVFPWNFFEDLKVLGGRAMAASGNDLDRAVALLTERCGLRVSRTELERALPP